MIRPERSVPARRVEDSCGRGSSIDRSDAVCEAQRNPSGEGDGLHTRQRLQLSEHLAMEYHAGFLIVADAAQII